MMVVMSHSFHSGNEPRGGWGRPIRTQLRCLTPAEHMRRAAHPERPSRALLILGFVRSPVLPRDDDHGERNTLLPLADYAALCLPAAERENILIRLAAAAASLQRRLNSRGVRHRVALKRRCLLGGHPVSG